MKKIQPLRVFGVLVFGVVWLVLLMYSIGWVVNWKLPGLAALKREFSSSKTTSSSTVVTSAAAASNIAVSSIDANGNNYCPNGWAVTYSDGHTKYTCTKTSSNPSNCGSSATFSTQWSSDGKNGTYSKKQWADVHHCDVEWDNPADGVPPRVTSPPPIYGDARAENSIGYGY